MNYGWKMKAVQFSTLLSEENVVLHRSAHMHIVPQYSNIHPGATNVGEWVSFIWKRHCTKLLKFCAANKSSIKQGYLLQRKAHAMDFWIKQNFLYILNNIYITMTNART